MEGSRQETHIVRLVDVRMLGEEARKEVRWRQEGQKVATALVRVRDDHGWGRSSSRWAGEKPPDLSYILEVKPTGPASGWLHARVAPQERPPQGRARVPSAEVKLKALLSPCPHSADLGAAGILPPSSVPWTPRVRS